MSARVPARKPYWEIFQGVNKSWYIHLKGANHVVVVSGGGYDTRENAARAIQWVRENAGTADGP
jgi:uncharacterized protein YegP (UPF0339 family)